MYNIIVVEGDTSVINELLLHHIGFSYNTFLIYELYEDISIIVSETFFNDIEICILDDKLDYVFILDELIEVRDLSNFLTISYGGLKLKGIFSNDFNESLLINDNIYKGTFGEILNYYNNKNKESIIFKKGILLKMLQIIICNPSNDINYDNNVIKKLTELIV
jgi:hypothetical protein